MVNGDTAALGARIASIRKALGYSSADIARAAGIDRMTLVRIENGESASPRIDTLKSIARALHLTDEGCGRLVLDP